MEGIAPLTNLESLTLEDGQDGMEIPLVEEVVSMLHDKLGPASSLKHVDMYGTVFRLVDGKWGPDELQSHRQLVGHLLAHRLRFPFL